MISGPAAAGEIESLLCRINAGSPFRNRDVRITGTAARLRPAGAIEGDPRVDEYDASIEKRFCFVADYDPLRREFVRLRAARLPKASEGFEREDLVPALELLLRDRASTVRVFSDTRERHHDLLIWGTVSFRVEIALDQKDRTPVFYQRNSAFAGPAEEVPRLSKKQILNIFEKRYRKLFPLPTGARLDEVWMADYPLSPENLVPVAEVWYRRRDQSDKNHMLFQFNPASHELTLFEKSWSPGHREMHGG